MNCKILFPVMKVFLFNACFVFVFYYKNIFEYAESGFILCAVLYFIISPQARPHPLRQGLTGSERMLFLMCME